jgi:hypothetical protein
MDLGPLRIGPMIMYYFSMRITSRITSWSYDIKSWDTVYSCLDFMMSIIMGSEVLSVINMNTVVFWDVALYSLRDAYQCFHTICCLLLLPWRWRQHIPQKNWWQCVTLYGITSHRTEAPVILFSSNIHKEILKTVIQQFVVII